MAHVALCEMKLNGKAYQPGDPVSLVGVEPRLIRQMEEHRRIAFAPVQVSPPPVKKP